MRLHDDLENRDGGESVGSGAVHPAVREPTWYTISATLVTTTLALCLLLHGAVGAMGILPGGGPWPESSKIPVAALEHPSIRSQLERHPGVRSSGFRFVAFGDQRALADGEWQALVRSIEDVERQRKAAAPLMFVLDTGDIVDDGSHSDQFHLLAKILAPLRAYPYLVGIGNHEVDNNRPGPARENAAAFLEISAPELIESRLYYRRDVGALRILFLDTNDLVYGPNGDEEKLRTISDRARRQLEWLRDQLAEPEGDRHTLVVMHHPLLASSKMHSGQGQKLWTMALDGVSLPVLLAAGGVDYVLTGHTHSYERFHLRAPGGGGFHLVNLSGRPRNSFLWFGSGRRAARDIRGSELAFLAERGWESLDGWRIDQREAMVENEENQWAEFTVGPDGTLTVRLHYLRDRGKDGYRATEPVVLD